MHDHRRLGRELELFDTDPLIGAGLPYWLPDGAAIRHALEEYVRAAERRAGYRHVYSPVLGKRELYEISGHWALYRDDMYPPMDLGRGVGGSHESEQMVLRPGLCPHHAVIYRSRSRGHRELPLRLAESGGMYRSERSGSLGGLGRVRAIQLNDAHVFCTPDQVVDEVVATLRMIGRAHAAMGIVPRRHRLSLPGPGGKYVDAPEAWRRSVALLVEALDRSGIAYESAEDEAAFYGPKIDVQFVDAGGREFTLSTVQVDLHQPARFDLSYVAADGARRRPVMVHRSVVGSVERAVAHLIEVHGGAFPAWLAPVQVVVLPVAEDQVGPALDLAARCEENGVRAEVVGPDQGGLGARVRAASRAPYQVVLGPKEVEEGSVSVRLRGGRRPGGALVPDFVARVRRVITGHESELWP
ncbi:threonine--tRNA ligase [Nocardiopsis sp. MG754419]|uniref:threonine--tRNA ligase n=1 Tax=Nocardiopsis sp. MG754419 TaxID=2259865 RepID=UPI001BAE3EDB|nr:threonine--tRNA ligase [Nocardiopsis sp. MG754419]